MNRILILCITAAALAGCMPEKQESATSGKLVALTCESQSEMMEQQVSQFALLYRKASISLETTTTRDAIVQLLNDSVRFICSDRKLNAEEWAVVKKSGLTVNEMKIAEDGLAVIVNKSNLLQSIRMTALDSIITGEAERWEAPSNGSMRGPVHLATTGPNSGIYELLTHTFFHPRRNDAPVFAQNTSREVIEFVAGHPGAIGFVPMAYVKRDSLPVSVLSIETIDSTGARITAKLHQANVYQHTYPLHYPVYTYTRTTGADVATGLSTFIAGAQGQRIILNTGLVPATMPVRLVQFHQE